MAIKYVKNSQINLLKWDRCIHRSFNGMIFAYSWYLNIICNNWDALIENDYEAVMPLVRKRRFFFNTLYEPFLINQLGIFSSIPLSIDKVDKFILSIPGKFKSYSIILNKYNKHRNDNTAKRRIKIYKLDLIKDHINAASKYSKEVKDKLRQARENKVIAKNNISLKEFYRFTDKQEWKTSSAIDKRNVSKLIRLVSTSIHLKLGKVYGAYSRHNNLCAITVFGNSHNRSYLIFAAVNREGEKNGSVYYLIDDFIHKFSENNLILEFNFTGKIFDSKFYKGFDAIECFCTQIRKRFL